MYLSPDKRNIKYVVKKVANDIEMAMTWLVDGLVDLGNKFPRTLVYCKSISDVAKIYDYVMDELPEEINSHVAMYHSETDESKKLYYRFEKKRALQELSFLQMPWVWVLISKAFLV